MKRLCIRSLIALLLITLTSTTISAADWGLFDLKGKVKSVTYTKGECPYFFGNETTSISFTSDGKISPITNVEITRNSRGHITSINSNIHDCFVNHKIARDSKERVTIITLSYSETTYDTQLKFYYNSNGDIYKSTEQTLWFNGNTSSETTTYTYQSYDDYGNWTKRTAKIGKESNVETRKITYHNGAKKVDKTTTKKATKSTESKKSTISSDSKKPSISKDSKKSSSSKSKSSKSSKK